MALVNIIPRRGRSRLPLALLAALALPAALANAQPDVGATLGAGIEAGMPVAVIVKVPKPWYAPRALIASRMRATVDTYRSLPGLAFKAYTLAQADGQFGGAYLWRDRDAAQAWFGPAWFERVRRERGVEPDVRFFAAPVSLDNTPGGTPTALDASSVVTLVLVAPPPGASRAQIVAGFQAAVPEYRQLPGLLRKDFVMAEDGRIGGVYLWRDAAAARAWFTPAWQATVRARHGAEPSIEWFDAPILLPAAAPVSPRP